MITRTVLPTRGEDAQARPSLASPFADAAREEWIRGLLSIGVIVLAIALVEFSRQVAGIPPRFLAAVAAGMALALVAVGLELGSPARAVTALLTAVAAFSLACLAGSQSSYHGATGAAFGVQALSTGVLALTSRESRDLHDLLLRVWCLFHATVAASLALGS